MEKDTLPTDNPGFGPNKGAHIIAPSYTDPKTGAVYVHHDLDERVAPWAGEAHIAPPAGEQRFGDVESWAAFVRRYGGKASTLVTWSSAGLIAVLDYHTNSLVITPGRVGWKASYAFVFTPEFNAWQRLTERPLAHSAAVEMLEDRVGEIVAPDAAKTLELLRNLRSNVSKTATARLRSDGTSEISFVRDSSVRGDDKTEIPGELKIGVQVLRGHVNDAGAAIKYELIVKVRASVGDDAKLVLRFSIPAVERVLETIFLERVAAAKAALGDDFPLLRGA